MRNYHPQEVAEVSNLVNLTFYNTTDSILQSLTFVLEVFFIFLNVKIRLFK